MHDLIIIGAGPAGLAAAIAAKEVGLDTRIFEKGVLVNALFHFPPQMVFFTTPDLLEIGGLPFVTPHGKPTRDETLRYYRRVVDTCDLQVDFGYRVTSVEPGASSDAPFTVLTRCDAHGDQAWPARTVLIASGCYDHPNRLGIPGEDLPHVSHYYTEPHEFYRRPVAVVGGKNSAAEAALDLYRSGAYVTLVHRGAELGASIKYWVKPDIENRIAEGSIPARFETRVVEIRPHELVVQPVDGGPTEVLPADGVFLLTGYLADLDIPPRRRRRRGGKQYSQARSRDLRDQRPRALPRRRGCRRRQPRRSLHRERTLPRQGGRRTHRPPSPPARRRLRRVSTQKAKAITKGPCGLRTAQSVWLTRPK